MCLWLSCLYWVVGSLGYSHHSKMFSSYSVVAVIQKSDRCICPTPLSEWGAALASERTWRTHSDLQCWKSRVWMSCMHGEIPSDEINSFIISIGSLSPVAGKLLIEGSRVEGLTREDRTDCSTNVSCLTDCKCQTTPAHPWLPAWLPDGAGHGIWCMFVWKLLATIGPGFKKWNVLGFSPWVIFLILLPPGRSSPFIRILSQVLMNWY